MNNKAIRLVPAFAGTLLLSTPVLLGGCLGPPSLDEPELVSAAPLSEEEAARAAARREMRANAEAAEVMDYPDAYAEPIVAAPVPLPMSQVAAAQASLLAAPRRSRAASPAEIAAGNARAAELRGLGRTHGAAAAEAIRRASAPR